MFVLPWFERRASASPDSIAVACEDRKVTYRELNLLAYQIACGLKQAGVASGTLVGVLLDRSPEMVAALLGVWKAGGAYIPLDPASPPQRIAFMLEDSAPALVLTQRKIPGCLSSTMARVIHLEDLCARLCSATLDTAEGIVSGDSLAYVIYTSGSTGKPKGVSITHGGLANTVEAVGRDLLLGPEDIVLAWSTIAFDAACLEMYLPLTSGATLHLVTQEPANGGRSRIEQLRCSAATVVLGTPTMYRLLLEEGWQGDARMRLIVGGEVLPLALARSLAGRCRALWNQYGPTETSICATRARIDPQAEKITIGDPLPNVRVHLLDQDLQPVPRGSIGEMFIGGVGVARGYLNRPDLNRARFLPDPFADGNGGWIYRSGDLAIQLADGRFDFIGRVDGQVKIRGFRIEIGEVESALSQCRGVQAAVVRVIELEPGDRRLVAFVIGDGDHLARRWKQSLGRQLPAYMVPSEFVSLRHFPTLGSGKIDLQALDAMRLSAANLPAVPLTSPADPVAAWLKVIWEKLLKRRTVGVDQDFFALGGHSLLAVRMLVQIEERFGCRLPHSVLVENPTIRGLAAYLGQSPTEQWPALVTIQPGTYLPPLFVAHGIGGSLLSVVELASELGPDRPVYGLQLPARIEEHQADLTILAGNYLRQLRAIQPSGPYHFAGHSSGGLMVFEIARQLREQGETVGLLALLDCDPETGKFIHQPLRDWRSLKASFRRAEFRWRQYGVKEMLRRRIIYQKLKIGTWLAARSRLAGKARSLVGAEAYLALALRECALKSYPGDVTLFVARDEPPSPVEPARAWEGRILGTCETRMIVGNHMTILNRPQVISLAQQIAQRMQVTAQASAPGVLA
jgi:amino acid adenylation domain-containing protein